MSTKELQFKDVLSKVPKESWFLRWLHLWKDTEPPRSYLFFVGMAMLGAPIARRAYLDHGHMKTWPMLNVLLIGPSGIGKGVSISFGLELISSLPAGLAPQVILGKPTPEKLHADLRDNPKSIVFAEELASFFTRQKYMESMVAYYTALLNYAPYIELRTKGEGLVRVVEPSVTTVGGSTPEWLQDQLPDTAMSGGFLPRFLIVYETKKFRRLPLPGLTFSAGRRAAWETEKRNIQRSFLECIIKAQGNTAFEDPEVADGYAEWYSQHRPSGGHLAPFAARAGEYVLRMAMLLAFSCGRAKIRESDVQAATSLYEYTESRMQDVVVPLTMKGRLLTKVLETIGDEAVTPTLLRRALRNLAPAPEIDAAVCSLVQSGEVQRRKDGKIERTKE